MRGHPSIENVEKKPWAAMGTIMNSTWEPQTLSRTLAGGENLAE